MKPLCSQNAREITSHTYESNYSAIHKGDFTVILVKHQSFTLVPQVANSHYIAMAYRSLLYITFFLIRINKCILQYSPLSCPQFSVKMVERV